MPILFLEASYICDNKKLNFSLRFPWKAQWQWVIYCVNHRAFSKEPTRKWKAKSSFWYNIRGGGARVARTEQYFTVSRAILDFFQDWILLVSAIVLARTQNNEISAGDSDLFLWLDNWIRNNNSQVPRTRLITVHQKCTHSRIDARYSRLWIIEPSGIERNWFAYTRQQRVFHEWVSAFDESACY